MDRAAAGGVDFPYKLPPVPARERGVGGGEVSPLDALAYEQALRRALTAPALVAALIAEREQAPRGSAVRGWLDAIDEDGFRLAALLVARLRFERLTRGSREADAWFEEAPGAFAEAFRAYHGSVAPGAYFPGHEARLFATWRGPLGG